MVNIVGPIRHVRNLGGAQPIPPLPPGGAERLFCRLKTRNWAITPVLRSMDGYSNAWGGENGFGPFRAPYSAKTRDRLVSETKRLLVRDVYANRPNLDGFIVGTFRRINELQNESGKSPEECLETIEQLQTELTQLEAARDQFRTSGQAKNERVPRLTEAAKNTYLAAKMAQEVADATMIAFDIVLENGQTGAEAKATLDQAANAIVARYDTWSGGWVGDRQRSPEWIQARIAANAITGGPDAYNADGTAAPGARILPGVVVHPLAPGAVDDAQNGIATANDAINKTTAAAKTQDKLLKQVTLFKGSPTFESYARRADEIERKLKLARNDLFKSLCHLDKTAYSEVENFRPYYDSIFEQYEHLAGVSQKLDGFRLSLGFPALRRDKLESSGKYQFKQWWKENAPGLVEFGGSMGLTAAEFGAYCLIAGGAIPSWLIGGAAFVAVTTINTVAIKAIQYMASDD